MNNFGQYLTVDDYLKKYPDQLKNEQELRAAAKAPESMCDVCKVESAWRHAGTGLCFSCTTGESDASEDIELVAE